MKKNMGIIDRVLRIIFAVAVAVLFFTDVIGGLLGIILLALGGILLITALIGTCPIFLLFRISSKKQAK